MEKKGLVSIIMPAYNAGKYIAKAIDSLIEQTYSDWELVIVDDCSKDNTISVVNNYSDSRIKLIKSSENSGSAFKPRNLALKEAQGEWVINLDADDFLAQDYIEDMLNRALGNRLDICCGKMVVVDGDTGARSGECIPINEFDFEQIINGEEAFLYTIPRWKIGLNGMLCKKTIWQNAIKNYPAKEKYKVHDDEVLSREMLLCATRVGFADVDYYFRTNNDSVTRKFSESVFDLSDSVQELYHIAKKRYGVNSIVYRNVQLYDFYSFIDALRLFLNNYYMMNSSEIKIFQRKFKEWHIRLNFQVIKKYADNGRKNIAGNLMLLTLSLIPNRQAPRMLYKWICYCGTKPVYAIRKNKFYNWYVVRKQREKVIKKQLDEKYMLEKESPKNKSNSVICMYEGKTRAGGLADRLKGIVGTYYICKQWGVDFKLYFVDPFPLADFFVPNEYDWSIKKEQISYTDCNVVILDTTQDCDYQHIKQKQYLEKKLARVNRQTHVYTNAGFSYDLDYQTCFWELFKLSDRLQEALDTQLEILGNDYLSVSCRFLNLLGDFNETCAYDKELSKDQAEKLVEDLLRKIEGLHNQYQSSRILVNSDSITFLEKVSVYKYVYVIPGNVTHIDGENNQYCYEKYEKTFLDFLMIANASKIFLLRTGNMHNSGYPYAASKIHNRPFELIEF